MRSSTCMLLGSYMTFCARPGGFALPEYGAADITILVSAVRVMGLSSGLCWKNVSPEVWEERRRI